MSTATENIYLGILSSETIPPIVQKRIFTFAKKQKSVSLLSTLAAHPSLISEVDVELGKFAAAKVKSAWAARSSRTIDELEELACKDTRAAILAELAVREDLSDVAYERMASREQLKVDWLLVMNPRLQLKTRKEIAKRLGASVSDANWKKQGVVAEALDEYPELADAFASTSESSALFELAARSPVLSVATQVHIVGKIVAITRTCSGNRYYGNRNRNLSAYTRALMSLAANPALSLEAVAVLKVVHNLRTPYAELDNARKAVLARESSLKDSKLSRKSLLEEARTTTDKATLGELVASVKKSKNAYLATLLISNPALPAVKVRSIASLVSPNDLPQLVRARKHDGAALAELLAAHTHSAVFTERLLGEAADPEDLLIRLTANKSTLQYRRQPDIFFNTKYVSRRVVATYSMASLDIASRSGTTRIGTLSQEVLLAAFGTSVAHWEVFETLTDTFEGSLQQLIDAVYAIVGEFTPDMVPVEDREATEALHAAVNDAVDTAMSNVTAPSGADLAAAWHVCVCRPDGGTMVEVEQPLFAI